MKNNFGKDHHYIFMKGKIAQSIQQLHLEETTETPFDISKTMKLIDNSEEEADTVIRTTENDLRLIHTVDDTHGYFNIPIKYLRGCLLATDAKTRLQYYTVIQDVLAEVKDREFKSLGNVYYRLSRSGVSDGFSSSRTQYWLDQAIRIDENNYQAKYRRAIRNGQKQNFEAEWEELKEIEDTLSKRKLLQPLEIEYLVKVWNMRAYLAKNGFIEKGKARAYLSELESVDKSLKRLGTFLRIFFGNEYYEHFDLMWRRIRSYLNREGVGVIDI